MDEEVIISYIISNPSCFDRFTFDNYMRLLLSIDFSHEEAKEFILCNCALSALVQQERIHNDTYLTIDNNISDDLLELKQEIFSKNFSNKN